MHNCSDGDSVALGGPPDPPSLMNYQLSLDAKPNDQTSVAATTSFMTSND